jgi:hypothetical protein
MDVLRRRDDISGHAVSSSFGSTSLACCDEESADRVAADERPPPGDEWTGVVATIAKSRRVIAERL